MRKLSWDEIKQIETEVYNEGYRGYEFDEESTLRMLEAMDKPPLKAQKRQPPHPSLAIMPRAIRPKPQGGWLLMTMYHR